MIDLSTLAPGDVSFVPSLHASRNGAIEGGDMLYCVQFSTAPQASFAVFDISGAMLVAEKGTDGKFWPLDLDLEGAFEGLEPKYAVVAVSRSL